MTLVSRRHAAAAAVLAVTMIPALATAPALAQGRAHTPAAFPTVAAARAGVTPLTDVSSACPGQNAEVEEATAAPDYVYAAWIGCGGIGFARSADGGLHWSAPVTVPGSADVPASGIGSWDPSVAVAPDGTVYVAFMHRSGPGRQPGTSMHPVVAASADHGASFSQVSQDLPPAIGNFGDRPFIAVGRTGTVYLTWDYGPSGPEVKVLCSSGGSCAYSNGDFNAVIQKSADGGRTWGPITHLEPGFPLGGGYSAPLVARPGGGVDVLVLSHPIDPGTLAVHPGYEYFTSSPDGVSWPAHPLRLWPGKGTISVPEWWIDGDIAADAAGNLYATWDTQTAQGDIGWLTWSADGGRTWSAPLRVTPDSTSAPHIVQVAGGPAGIAYIGWLTSAPVSGYALFLRPFSIRGGWLGPAIQVSGGAYGNPTIWPGDTFGMSVLPGPRPRISLSWGSAVGSSQDAEIYAAEVTLPPGS